MYPVLFEIGDFTVTTFGLMIFLALLTGAWVLAREFRRRGLDPEHAWDMLVWLAFGGILGAKLYYVGLQWEDLIESPLRTLTSRAGLVWYGAFIGGMAALFWQIRKRKLPTFHVLDSAAPGIAMGYAVGRIGCFLVGDDYGQPTDSWVGVAFPEGAPPSTAGYFRSIGMDVPAYLPDGAVLAVHPTQLYETALALIIFAVLIRLARKSLAPGRVFAAFMAMYGVERFLIEFVRAKTDHVLFGLTTSQIASVALLGLAAWLWRRQGDRAAEQPPAPAPAEHPRPAGTGGARRR